MNDFILRMTLCTIYIKQIWRPVWIIWSLDTVRTKKQFDVNKFGKWKFAEDEDIRAIVGDNDTDMKISIMADVGRCDYKHSIRDRADSPVDLIRVATYINTMLEAIAMIEDAAAKGYETTCNIMAISKCQGA